MDKYRDETLDWISGLMILYMIFYHVGYMSNLDDVIYIPLHILSFFMPYFFFKSGMFFRVKENKVMLNSSFKRLIIPFLIFGLIGTILFTGNLIISKNYDAVNESISFSLKNGVPTLGNAPLWYLLSLFIIRVCFNYLVKYVNIWIIMLFSLFIPFMMYYYDWNELTIISHTLLGLFYFICGFKLSKFQYNKHVFYTCAIVFVAMAIFTPCSVEFFHNSLNYGYYLLDIPYSLCAIITLDNIIKITPWKYVKSLKLHIVGKHSMTLLVTHMLFIMFAIPLCKFIGMNTPWNKGIIFTVILIICLPFMVKLFGNSKLKWMMGE